MQRCPRVKRGKLGGADIARGKETDDGDGQITEAGSMRDVIVTDGPTDADRLGGTTQLIYLPLSAEKRQSHKDRDSETHRVAHCMEVIT